jgi:hypothetical protein
MTIKYSKQSNKVCFFTLILCIKKNFYIVSISIVSLMNITRNYSFVGASIIMGLLLIVSVTLLPNPSFAQQENQTNMTSSQQQNQSGVNQTGGGQEGQQQQQQNQTGIGTSQELENLTGLSNETIANNTDIESPNATTMGGLEREQTSTETTNMSSTQQQNQSEQQQQQNQSGGNQTGGGQEGQNQTRQGPLEQLGETLGGIFGGGN